MTNLTCEKIFNAIKLDNLIDFSQLISGNENLSFGRFPILSVCYLYNSNKIIKKYEKTLCKITDYKIVNETFELYQKFKSQAGRCLRLYLNNATIVSPLEMLAVLHQDSKLKKCFKTFAKTMQSAKNLNTIYNTIYCQKTTVSKDKIIIGTKPFSYNEKKSFKIGLWTSLAYVISFAIIFMSFAFTMGVGLPFSKAKISNQSQFVSALNSGGNFVLQNNFTISSKIQNISFYGEIDGQNNTIYIDKIPDVGLILNNNGTIKNLNIVYNNIQTDLSKSLSLLVNHNYGTIENVSITCNQLNLNCAKNSNDIYVTGFAKQNNGYIKNCSIKLNGSISATGDGECYVSGFVGINNGTVSGCEFKAGSEVQTTEVDLTGFAITNNEKANISACKNYASLSQTSQQLGWSPNVSGISQTNYGAITNCYNYGTISATSTYPEQTTQGLIFVGGITANNYGNLTHCLNKGSIIATSQYINIYAGGISGYSSYWIKNDTPIMPVIKNCGSSANLNVSTQEDKTVAFVGGISGFMWGELYDNYSISTFTNGNNDTKYFVGTCIGCAYWELTYQGPTIRLDVGNNYMLLQDNVTYHIGSLINNGSIVSKGQDSPNRGVVTLSTLEQIQQQEVYWNEQN